MRAGHEFLFMEGSLATKMLLAERRRTNICRGTHFIQGSTAPSHKASGTPPPLLSSCHCLSTARWHLQLLHHDLTPYGTEILLGPLGSHPASPSPLWLKDCAGDAAGPGLQMFSPGQLRAIGHCCPELTQSGQEQQEGDENWCGVFSSSPGLQPYSKSPKKHRWRGPCLHSPDHRCKKAFRHQA